MELKETIANPFEMLASRLIKIETMLIDLQKQHSADKVKSQGEPEYLSVVEAAQFLGVSQGSIYRYVMNGVLPKRKFGNKLYFPKRLLEDLIEKGA